MKNYLFLLVSLFTFSLILVGCGTSEKNEGNETKVESTRIQNEKTKKDIKEDMIEDNSNEASEKDNAEQVAVDSKDNAQKTGISDEEIENIVADTYLNILSVSEDAEVSFYEAIEDDLLTATIPVEVNDVVVHGLDPQSTLYQTIYDFFNPEMQQYVTEIGMDSVLADHYILYLNPRNETALSPTFNQFQVLEKSEDEFVVKHWFEGEDYSLAYETTFVLEDANWKFVRAMYTNR